MHSEASITAPCHPSVLAQSLNLSYVKELLILGLLENPLECVVCCLIAVMCGLTGNAYRQW